MPEITDKELAEAVRQKAAAGYSIMSVIQPLIDEFASQEAWRQRTGGIPGKPASSSFQASFAVSAARCKSQIAATPSRASMSHASFSAIVRESTPGASRGKW